MVETTQREHGAHEPAPPAPPTSALLRRSTDDRVVFGVAGGLGRYLGIDPVLTPARRRFAWTSACWTSARRS